MHRRYLHLPLTNGERELLVIAAGRRHHERLFGALPLILSTVNVRLTSPFLRGNDGGLIAECRTYFVIGTFVGRAPRHVARAALALMPIAAGIAGPILSPAQEVLLRIGVGAALQLHLDLRTIFHNGANILPVLLPWFARVEILVRGTLMRVALWKALLLRGCRHRIREQWRRLRVEEGRNPIPERLLAHGNRRIRPLGIHSRRRRQYRERAPNDIHALRHRTLTHIHLDAQAIPRSNAIVHAIHLLRRKWITGLTPVGGVLVNEIARGILWLRRIQLLL